MKRITGVTTAAVVLFASASAAQLAEDRNGWLCGVAADWELASLRLAPELILNNFFFEEADSFRTDMTVLQITYSSTNRSEDPYSMTGQFVGYDDEGVATFAMSASPDFDMASPGTETARDDVYVVNPVLARTTTICAAFAVESR